MAKCSQLTPLPFKGLSLWISGSTGNVYSRAIAQKSGITTEEVNATQTSVLHPPPQIFQHISHRICANLMDRLWLRWGEGWTRVHPGRLRHCIFNAVASQFSQVHSVIRFISVIARDGPIRIVGDTLCLKIGALKCSLFAFSSISVLYLQKIWVFFISQANVATCLKWGG